MTEEEARAWLIGELSVPRETLSRIDSFVELLRDEAAHQNLVASSTLEHVWDRHIVDSAQLLRFAPAAGRWLDLGSGAGFPGLIVAALGSHIVTLIESRRKRAEFLRAAVAKLGISSRTHVHAGRAEAAPAGVFDVISARAFAPLDRLLTIGARFASPDTCWLLPKGRGAQAELDAARRTWQGAFRTEPSVTDPGSSIIVAEQVRRKEQR